MKWQCKEKLNEKYSQDNWQCLKTRCTRKTSLHASIVHRRIISFCRVEWLARLYGINGIYAQLVLEYVGYYDFIAELVKTNLLQQLKIIEEARLI